VKKVRCPYCNKKGFILLNYSIFSNFLSLSVIAECCLFNFSAISEIDILLSKRFTERLIVLGILHTSFIDKQGRPRYHINLYSFRKRFGTFAYKKTRCPQTTALLLFQSLSIKFVRINQI
jgi:hypothetical protein